MPKRVLDFDAMWGSDKLASCAAWAQAEYAWLYGLADPSGCFELTNLRVIWGRVAAVRGDLTIERLERVFAEFQDKGLLFVWEHEGKRYGHWTGSDVPGRLPPPSWRMRLERFAPPVPKQLFAQYMARFARGRAALAGVGFRGAEPLEAEPGQRNFPFESADWREARGHSCAAEEQRRRQSAMQGGLKPCLEEDQAQDLDLDRDLGVNGNLVGDLHGEGRRAAARNGTSNLRDTAESSNRGKDLRETDSKTFSSESFASPSAAAPRFSGASSPERLSARELAVQRELRVGQGPVCAPRSVKAEAIERDRRRLAAQAESKSR